MKKLFLTFVVAGLTLTAAAQKTEKQVATLQHGNQTSVFYGINAFVSAYNAAADTLDVITLSGGEFNVPSPISKSIAIYGAGCENDPITGTQRTYLNGGLYLKPADGVDDDGLFVKAEKKVNGVHIEGVYVSGYIGADNNNDEPIHNLSIVKCRTSSGIYFNVDCYDCIIRQSIANSVEGWSSSNPSKAYNLLISNCHLNNNSSILSNFTTTSTIFVDHCIVRSIHSGASAARCTNNIIYQSSLPTGADGANNIFITTSGTATSTTTDGSWYNMRNQGVWADDNEDGTYAADKTFELKYPDRYIGTDGTQIGLHGGVYAWNKTPVIPRITECTIDTDNVNNGTLKVSIKAEAQTKE